MIIGIPGIPRIGRRAGDPPGVLPNIWDPRPLPGPGAEHDPLNNAAHSGADINPSPDQGKTPSPGTAATTGLALPTSVAADNHDGPDLSLPASFATDTSHPTHAVPPAPGLSLLASVAADAPRATRAAPPAPKFPFRYHSQVPSTEVSPYGTTSGWKVYPMYKPLQ